MLNRAVEGSIDQKAIHKGENLSKFQIIENLNLALKAAKEIGCVVVNIGHEDVVEGKPHAILGLLWQILRIDLLNDVNVLENVQVIALKRDTETLQQFMKLEDREVLLRWINYQLQRGGNGSDDQEVVQNFGADLRDSSVYVRLLRTVAPHLVSEEEAQETMQEEDLMKRAERVIEMADRLDMQRKIYIEPEDIVQGSTRINTAYIAAIFDSCKDSSLATPETEDAQKMLELRTQMLDIVVEELAKDLPSVRSSKFTAFIQAAKNLTQVTRSSFEESSVLDNLRKAQEAALETKQQLKETQDREQQYEQQVSEMKEQLDQCMEEHAKELSEERERADQLESNLKESETTIRVNEERFEKRLTEQQSLYETQLEMERIVSSDLESQIQELREQMQKQKEDYEKQIEELRREMEQKVESLEKQLSDEKERFTLLESEHQELQQTSSDQKQEIEKMVEARTISSEKSRDLVQRLLNLKEVLRQTRQDLDYGMSMAGTEAETKLAIHRFGEISATALQTKFTPTRTGQMYKRGTKVKSWKKRYHILVQNYLFYFATAKDKDPKGFVRVDDCTVEPYPEANKPHSFRIIVKSREFVCHCESQKEMDSWIFAIREAGNLDTVTSSSSN